MGWKSSPILLEPMTGIEPATCSFLLSIVFTMVRTISSPTTLLGWVSVARDGVIDCSSHPLVSTPYQLLLWTSLVLVRYRHLRYELRFHRVHPIIQLPLLIEVAFSDEWTTLPSELHRLIVKKRFNLFRDSVLHLSKCLSIYLPVYHLGHFLEY